VNLNSLFQGVVDLFFPPRCLSCSELLISDKSFGFCPECLQRISFLSPPVCSICGASLPGNSEKDALCHRCAMVRPPFEMCRSVGQYESVLLEAIHDLKYRGVIAAGVVLGNLLTSYAGTHLPVGEYDKVIPVPLHRKRLRERGFNQSLLLAKAVAHNFSLKLDFSSLRRRIHTQPQISLGKKDRAANVRNAFEVVRGENITGSRILLVDDVYTTGSTVRECARVLLEGGAQSVSVVTVARA
jgi:ComF family protein